MLTATEKFGRAGIEYRLLNHPALEQCCVCGSGQTHPHAIVVLSEHARRLAAAGRPALEQDLTEHLDAVNRELAAHERLEFLAVVEGPWFPENGLLTPTLKVKRRRIDDVYGPLVTGWTARKRRSCGTAARPRRPGSDRQAEHYSNERVELARSLSPRLRG